MEMFFSMSFRQVETRSVASREGRGNRRGVIIRLMSAQAESGPRGSPQMVIGSLDRKASVFWQQEITARSKAGD
jgi:hypothetical protein